MSNKCLMCDEDYIFHEIQGSCYLEYQEEEQQQQGKGAGNRIEVGNTQYLSNMLPLSGDSKSWEKLSEQVDRRQTDGELGFTPKKFGFASTKIKNFLEKLVTPELIAAGETSRQLNPEKLIHQIISSQYNMTKIYSENYERKDILLYIDYSGSVSRYSFSTVPAGFYLAKKYPRIQVIFGFDGIPTAAYGSKAKTYARHIKKLKWNYAEAYSKTKQPDTYKSWRALVTEIGIRSVFSFSDYQACTMYGSIHDLVDLSVFDMQNNLLEQYEGYGWGNKPKMKYFFENIKSINDLIPLIKRTKLCPSV